MTTKTKAATKKAATKPIAAPVDQNPIWTALLGDLGPMYAPVDTDYRVLESRAVMALAERATS